MRKRLCCWLCAVAIIGWLLLPMGARALTPLEVERPCSLTLHYTQEGIGFQNLQIRIWRVAEAFDDGTFELISPFSSYPVNIHGISSQTEWKTVATTLTAYIAAEQVQPNCTGTTDESGTVAFSELETGLYLVSGAVAEHESGTYRFDDFMVYLPTPQDGGSFHYDLQAKPKCVHFTPATQYQVVKLWKDAGYSNSRPSSVTVGILKDGVLQETKVLSAENNWTYTWKVPDGKGVWTVVEKDVPDDYTVSIQVNEATFLITNTHTAPGDTPPTGDTAAPWLYMLCMCLSGFLFLILGIRGKRGYTNEQAA